MTCSPREWAALGLGVGARVRVRVPAQPACLVLGADEGSPRSGREEERQ